DLDRAARAAESLSRAEGRKAETAAAREAAAAAQARAEAELREAETAAETAGRSMEAARRAARAAEAASRLAELRARLERAEEARRRGEQAAAEARGLAVPDAELAALDALERRITELKAALAASALRLTVNYEAGAAGRVRLGDVVLADGETRALAGLVTLDLDGIGRLTLAPGEDRGAAEIDAALETAEAERRDALARLGAEDLAALRARAARAAEARSTARSAKAELDAHAPEGLDALRLAIGQLEDATAPSDPGESAADPQAAEAAHAAAVTRLGEARAARETARARHEAAREADINASHELTRAREGLDALDETLGPEDGRTARLAALRAAESETADTHAKARAGAEALRADAPDLAAAEAAATRAASALARAREETEQLEREIAGLTGRITARAEEAIEERHEETRGRLEAARAHLGHVEAEVAALTRLRRALDEARTAARDQYFGPVMAELKPLLAMLLDEASVGFDDTTLLPETLGRDGQDEAVAALSGGTREQLAVLTRLAFARLLARGGQPVPVILDDALVYSDDARIEKMFDALHRQARDLQIIVLTCRARAFERLGGQGLRMTDWRPQD
ncbi:chromosome segregation protein SMC, partial [Limibaculum sp. M0105]|nr:chromosome segregation protein SMC [Thermohalobaculum xanthum]